MCLNDFCDEINAKVPCKISECMCKVWFKRIFAAYVITCIVGVICCVYCTWMVLITKELSKTCSRLPENVDDGRNLQEIQVFHSTVEDIKTQFSVVNEDERKSHSVLTGNNFRFKRSNNKEQNKSTERKKEPKKKKKKTEPAVIAAHYIPSSKEPFPKKPLDQVLSIFKPIDWVNDSTSPFTLHQQGNFIARYHGIHLVYAQVLFFDTKTEHQVLGIVQKRNGTMHKVQEHYCFTGFSSSLKAFRNTCSLMALFHLETGDVLEVVNHFINVNVDLHSPSTFFGAILLR